MLATVGVKGCAIPLAEVVETLRPLPVAPIAGAPAFLLGLSTIRGRPTPVVDLALLLGEAGAPPATRWLALRVGERRVALAVTAVLGVRSIEAALLSPAPPLLGDERSPAASLVEAVGALDEQLLLVLRSARVLPEALWRELHERHELATSAAEPPASAGVSVGDGAGAAS